MWPLPMAGSLKHLIDDDGNFAFDLIDNMGDAHEACEDCVAEIERLRASLEKMHTRSDERDDAIEREAFEEAAKIAEDGWESPEAIAAAIRAKAEEVQGK